MRLLLNGRKLRFGYVELHYDFVLLRVEGLLRDAEEVCHLFKDNVILVFGEVVLERHKVA